MQINSVCPTELLYKIIFHLELPDLKTVKKVCKQWNGIVQMIYDANAPWFKCLRLRLLPNRLYERKRGSKIQDERRGQGEDTLVRSKAQEFAAAASSEGRKGSNLGLRDTPEKRQIHDIIVYECDSSAIKPRVWRHKEGSTFIGGFNEFRRLFFVDDETLKGFDIELYISKCLINEVLPLGKYECIVAYDTGKLQRWRIEGNSTVQDPTFTIPPMRSAGFYYDEWRFKMFTVRDSIFVHASDRLQNFPKWNGIIDKSLSHLHNDVNLGMNLGEAAYFSHGSMIFVIAEDSLRAFHLNDNNEIEKFWSQTLPLKTGRENFKALWAEANDDWVIIAGNYNEDGMWTKDPDCYPIVSQNASEIAKSKMKDEGKVNTPWRGVNRRSAQSQQVLRDNWVAIWVKAWKAIFYQAEVACNYQTLIFSAQRGELVMNRCFENVPLNGRRPEERAFWLDGDYCLSYLNNSLTAWNIREKIQLGNANIVNAIDLTHNTLFDFHLWKNKLDIYVNDKHDKTIKVYRYE